MSPVCLGGTYVLTEDLMHLDPFTVEAVTVSSVCIRDGAGRRSQIALPTFHAHWTAVP